MPNTIQKGSEKKQSQSVCLHDRYVSKEMSGKFPDYLLQRLVSICVDCGKDISYLRLLRR